MPHIKNNAELQNAITYAKEYVSAGTANMIPLRVGEATQTIDTERAAVKLYWEAYETIGCPAINTWDDLIDVLKQMKEVYPENDKGDPTYGARLFANDGSYFYSIYNWYVVNGVDVNDLPYFVECNAVTESFDYILDDDSLYKEGLKFFNKMYREGLVDPDSMTSTRAQQQAMVTAGAALAGWAGAPGWEQYGYYPVYIGESVSLRNETGYPFGSSGYLAISAATENVEACLKLLDMFANPDDLITISCGPKGELWDVDDSGKGYVTDKGYRYWTHGDTVKIKGEEFVLFNTQYLLNTGAMTSYGIPWSVGGCWELVEYNASTDLFASWKETYPGYSGFREMLLDKDQFVNEPFHANASQFAAETDDARKLIMNAAKAEIVTASWKMIYAKTDAEFEQLWDAAVAKCEEAGIKAVYEWRVAELEKAMTTRDEFLK
ncbi:MAG: extracellular solute-binding protein [Ruminococcaceae bacterium]|nr:extracellular solute-binding protein [Oscillospiraceae bacterium]